MLAREEYVEQAYFFRTLGERLAENIPLQDLLGQVKEELLATTNLPLAIDFLLAELRHRGLMHTAMQRLTHYFTPFQTYVMREAESERGRFDYRIALDILRFEAQYLSEGATPQGLFLYQFETLCRNRLRYDHGLAAMAQDPLYDPAWRDWILSVRRRLGTVDLPDLIYVRSAHHERVRQQQGRVDDGEEPLPVLFAEKEGRIALACRRKDPLFLFAALQRQLGYPTVPRPKPIDDSSQTLTMTVRRLDQLETRVKLLEDDQRGGFDLTKFYQRPPDSSSGGSR